MTQYFSTNVSVALTLLATIMWGSWMQVVKHRGKYPVTGLIFLLYLFSLVLVGVVTAVVSPFVLTESIWSISAANPRVVAEIIFGGALMGIGMFFSLTVMSQAGLLLATTISGAVGTILGLATSLLKEGIPERPNAVLLIVLVTGMSLLAGWVCSAASRSRDKDVGKPKGTNTVTAKIIIMSLVAAVCTNGWSIGTATGTANAFPPVLTSLYMAVGCFLSTLVMGVVLFTKNKQWKQVLCLGGYSKKPLLLGAIAAVCHFGGNILSIYSMPTLSATLSFLFARVGGVVTIAWGLYYKEFAGSSKKTKIILIAGVVIYFLTFALLGYYTYG